MAHKKLDLERLLGTYDAKNLEEVAGFPTEDCRFVFGSNPPLEGKEAIIEINNIKAV
ncbi:nuclear transport factor 2 family protein [Paenibacillus sp. P26]|nr:nuclear transport factor 2 family protein [Paenibacillus sp. P26]UUZ91941.1 nuclear transport factor 2 family protein [Paenibacillus sp. P25]